mmetsp:Transcript_14127/g.49749  ORF Transcript_14127/g.49749 Transcript_14127/m.49749 type:complete len:221 (+) Transcript_14127:1447-2109(+)
MQLRAVTCKQSPNWIGSGCFPNEKRLQVHCGQVFSGLHHWSARLMRSSERTDVQSSAGRILYLASARSCAACGRGASPPQTWAVAQAPDFATPPQERRRRRPCSGGTSRTCSSRSRSSSTSCAVPERARRTSAAPWRRGPPPFGLCCAWAPWQNFACPSAGRSGCQTLPTQNATPFALRCRSSSSGICSFAEHPVTSQAPPNGPPMLVTTLLDEPFPQSS